MSNSKSPHPSCPVPHRKSTQSPKPASYTSPGVREAVGSMCPEPHANGPPLIGEPSVRVWYAVVIIIDWIAADDTSG